MNAPTRWPSVGWTDDVRERRLASLETPIDQRLAAPVPLTPNPPARGRATTSLIELPHFGASARPEPESTRRRALLHAFAIAAIAFTLIYLGWRFFAGTIDLSVWWVAVPLFIAEAHNGFGLILFTVALWDVDAGPRVGPVKRTDWRVAVFIPTYNEPESVLLPTIAAAVALEPGHETWVLDDGRRPNIKRLAHALGAHYLTRPTNEHYKAGNLNHALASVRADIVAVLDADHVPLPGLLTNTLAYFDDPRVAVVQTPQDFYNSDSFEHEGGDGDQARFLEEAIFYRVIAPAKNRWGGAFWCGTGALLRVEAIDDVGGVATDSVTEDIQTTIRMNQRGWKAVFHNEVLARGLAPADAIQYWTQRHRWALGAMQVLRDDNPLLAPGLTPGQRLSFVTTLAGWFDSWRTLVFMLVPPLVLATGASPIDAPGRVYGPLFLLAFVSQFAALRLLARGRYPPLLSLLFEVLRLPAVLPATLALVTGGSRVFRVTPKAPEAGAAGRIPVPLLLRALLALAVGAELWFIATLLSWTPTVYAERAAAIGALAFNTLNIGLIVAAVRRIRAAEFAGERRWSVRLPVRLPARLDRRPCRVLDLSVTGALVELLPAGLDAEKPTHVLAIQLPNGVVELPCRVRGRRAGEGARILVGLEFEPGASTLVAEVALALMWGEAAPSSAQSTSAGLGMAA